MAHLEVLEHSTVYRNPQPNRVSEYVSFPAILALPDDVLVCMCRHGSARESDDGRLRIHRSTDGGRTWSHIEFFPEPTEGPAGNRLPGGFGVSPNGDALAWLCHSGDGKKIDYVSRSRDSGLSWSEPMPVEIEPFSTFGPGGNLVTLADGTIIAAGEAGSHATGVKKDHWASLVTRSTDNGRSWEPVTIAHLTDNPFYLDLRLTGLRDGRLLASYWTHDMQTDQGLNVHTAWSPDCGRTWTEPVDARFWGQVTDICALQSGRVIAVTNHRRNPLGVRAVLSEDDGATFDEESHLKLWGVEPARIRSAPTLAPRRDVVEDVLASYHHFTFGTPSVTQLADGTVVAAFYVTEESVTYVRCCRIVERE